eukprot:scaffold25153_cov68-Phaeocystis_antarctica.AAC.1
MYPTCEQSAAECSSGKVLARHAVAAAYYGSTYYGPPARHARCHARWHCRSSRGAASAGWTT